MSSTLGIGDKSINTLINRKEDRIFNGEDLLKTFTELNIELGNVDPNVIRGWFDTDDPDMIHLLNWLCSLSKENILTPQEKKEYEKLDTPLDSEELEHEVDQIEKDNPNIFDIPTMQFNIELLEDEKEILVEEQKSLNDMLVLNKEIEKSLTSELMVFDEHTQKNALESSQENCTLLAENLDQKCCNLNEQVQKYGQYLYNFHFNEFPSFLHNKNLNEFEGKFETTSSFINTIIKNYKLDADESLVDDLGFLNKIYERILGSQQRYYESKIHQEEIKGALDFLQSYVIDIKHKNSLSQSKMNFESRSEQAKLMNKKLQSIMSEIAEFYLFEPKLNLKKDELEIYQERIASLLNIKTILSKLLSNVSLTQLFYNTEMDDLNSTDDFFKKVLHYISNNINNISARKDSMNEIVDEFNDFNAQPIEKQNALLTTLLNLVCTEESPKIQSGFKIFKKINYETTNLEKNLYCNDFNNHVRLTKKLKQSNKYLEQFLHCGPTSNIVVVPLKIQTILHDLQVMLGKQNTALQSVVKNYNDTKSKLLKDKWETYYRQIWVHFLTNQPEISSLLKIIEEKCSAEKEIFRS